MYVTPAEAGEGGGRGGLLQSIVLLYRDERFGEIRETTFLLHI